VEPIVLWLETGVSETRAASIFRVEVSGERKVDMYVGTHLASFPSSRALLRALFSHASYWLAL